MKLLYCNFDFRNKDYWQDLAAKR